MSFDKYELWNTSTLLGVMRETEAVSNYWLDLLFPNVMTSDDEYIDLEKIPSTGRKLAPLVVPMAQGRPIYEEGSRVSRFKPGYAKPMDPVTPNRVLTRRPGSLLNPTPTSPMAKYNAIKADILRFHRDAIERLHEWMAAKAAIDGKVTLEGDDYPERLVDFQRHADHTKALGAGEHWGTNGVSIVNDLQSWMDLMHQAEFGGAPNRLTIGTDVWTVMRKDPEIIDLMDLTKKNSDVDLQRGLLRPGEVRFVGTLGIGLEVYVYNDWYTVNGVVTPFMNSKDIVLTGPNVQGYRCFGAIQDINAQFQPIPIFPRNFIPQGDPAIEHILTQSAPLMVPVNPNATLKARVLA